MCLTQARQMAADKMPQANFGPKYEQHVQSLQKHLEEANKRIEDLVKNESAIKSERDAKIEELADLQVGHLIDIIIGCSVSYRLLLRYLIVNVIAYFAWSAFLVVIAFVQSCRFD